jgi:hypothetical protein
MNAPVAGLGPRCFPAIDGKAMTGTRTALHAYARVLGVWLKACRRKRKHWWHASLRPSLRGLTTGVIHAEIDFELELDLRASLLQGRTSSGGQLKEPLQGHSAEDLAEKIREFLNAAGINGSPELGRADGDSEGFEGYSFEQAAILGRVLNSVAAAMELFQAGIREETSPIQFWPHHFDLAMLWLPGGTVSGQDAKDEEYSDPQMNFGFTFGDQMIPDPYFYVTAYPTPAALPRIELPAGTIWRTEGFSGAVLSYQSLSLEADPSGYLLDLWNRLLSAGRAHMNAGTI